MKQTIYIETSVVSYLTARPSTDAIQSACQHVTHAWWASAREAAICYISPYVVEEARAGDSEAAQARLRALKDLPVLPTSPEIVELAEFLVLGGGLPAKAKLDALHIACAAWHDLDILLTWNCTHIANPARLPILRGLSSARGLRLPELVTPFELLEAVG